MRDGIKKVHLIIDISYLYHRHIYSVRSGARRKLSAIVDGQLVDTTMIYFTLQDLEAIRKRWLTACDELVVSICFDSKSDRKDENKEYKSKRNSLTEDDFNCMRNIQEIVTNIGYNVYKAQGMEADDLVTSLVSKYKDDFDFTVIYTPDSDLLVNLGEKVGLMRYKTSLAKLAKGKDVMDKAHLAIGVNNYSIFMSDEWGCWAPYNVTMLYKCTVGDSSDNVPGIKGFGPAAFDGYLKYLTTQLGVTSEQFAEMNKAENVEEILKRSAEYFGEFKLQQALEALELVKFRQVDVGKPEKRDSNESRNTEYGRYSMVSLFS